MNLDPQEQVLLAALTRASAEVMVVRFQKDFDDVMEQLRIVLEDEGKIEKARDFLVEFARAGGVDLTPYLDAPEVAPAITEKP